MFQRRCQVDGCNNIVQGTTRRSKLCSLHDGRKNREVILDEKRRVTLTPSLYHSKKSIEEMRGIHFTNVSSGPVVMLAPTDRKDDPEYWKDAMWFTNHEHERTKKSKENKTTLS